MMKIRVARDEGSEKRYVLILGDGVIRKDYWDAWSSYRYPDRPTMIRFTEEEWEGISGIQLPPGQLLDDCGIVVIRGYIAGGPISMTATDSANVTELETNTGKEQ